MTPDLRKALWDEYGPVMDARAICRVLYYPSLNTLQAAKARGTLPFNAFHLEGRRGVFALTDDVCSMLLSKSRDRSCELEPPKAGSASPATVHSTKEAA